MSAKYLLFSLYLNVLNVGISFARMGYRSEIQNYLLSYGSQALIPMDPRALGMGPIIDVFILWKF